MKELSDGTVYEKLMRNSPRVEGVRHMTKSAHVSVQSPATKSDTSLENGGTFEKLEEAMFWLSPVMKRTPRPFLHRRTLWVIIAIITPHKSTQLTSSFYTFHLKDYWKGELLWRTFKFHQIILLQKHSDKAESCFWVSTTGLTQSTGQMDWEEENVCHGI